MGYPREPGAGSVIRSCVRGRAVEDRDRGTCGLRRSVVVTVVRPLIRVTVLRADHRDGFPGPECVEEAVHEPLIRVVDGGREPGSPPR